MRLPFACISCVVACSLRVPSELQPRVPRPGGGMADGRTARPPSVRFVMPPPFHHGCTYPLLLAQFKRANTAQNLKVVTTVVANANLDL